MYNKSQLHAQLFALQDCQYRDFHSHLLPPDVQGSVIGIRIPNLRKFSVQYRKEHSEDITSFFRDLPHTYYEENVLHMMLLSQMKDYTKCLKETLKFLPYIDNWAVCDLPAPKCFAARKEELFPQIKDLLHSSHTYTVRYGIGLLLRLYLDADFQPSHLALVSSIQTGEYYINMMIAWYFATALVKQWDAAIPYLEEKRLSEWVHKKTIQKAIESYRITPEQKDYLKTLRQNKSSSSDSSPK